MSKIKSIKQDNTPPIFNIIEIDKRYTAEVLKCLNDGYIIKDTLDGKIVLKNPNKDNGVCVNKRINKDNIIITTHPVIFNYNNFNTVICSDILDKIIYYRVGDKICTTDVDYWRKCYNLRLERDIQNRDDFFIDYIKHELGYKNFEIITYPHTKQFIKHILPMINRKCGFKSIRASHIGDILKATGKGCTTYIATFTPKAPTKMPCLAFKKYYQMNMNELIF